MDFEMATAKRQLTNVVDVFRTENPEQASV
jgi:hypothetical protein